jgi:hypothetical protein
VAYVIALFRKLRKSSKRSKVAGHSVRVLTKNIPNSKQKVDAASRTICRLKDYNVMGYNSLFYSKDGSGKSLRSIGT